MRTACVIMGRAESLLRAHYLSEDASLGEGRMRQLIRSCVTEELRSRLVLTDDVWPCMSLHEVTSPPTGGCCVRGFRDLMACVLGIQHRSRARRPAQRVAASATPLTSCSTLARRELGPGRPRAAGWLGDDGCSPLLG